MRDYCLNMRHVQLKPIQGLLGVGNATPMKKPQASYRSPTDAQSGISTCQEYPGLLPKLLCHILLHIIVWHEHMTLEGSLASHKSNPSSIPQVYVDTYSTLPWVMWEAVRGVEGIPCWGYYDVLANGALVYPSQGRRYRAEGCKALG